MMSAIASVGIVAMLCIVMPVSLHAHEHEGEGGATQLSNEEGEEIEQLQKLIALLTELVSRMRAQESRQTVPMVSPVVVMDDDALEMQEHHSEHAATTTSGTTAVPRLVIEVEAHHDDTHVHVRYVDKPEDMFFVGSDITDRTGIVRDIQLRTGLSTTAIESALTFLE